jgi:hypothetical protein
MSASRVEKLAKAALRKRLRELSGDPLDRAGRVKSINDAVSSSVPDDASAQALEDVRAGDGNELAQPAEHGLAPRLHSARSSCALAVSALGPWQCDPTALQLFGRTAADRLASVGFDVRTQTHT